MRKLSESLDFFRMYVVCRAKAAVGKEHEGEAVLG